jgi:hypothetical protein
LASWVSTVVTTRLSTTVPAAGMPRCVMHPPRLQAASTAIEFHFQLGSGFNFLACNVQDRVNLVWIFLQGIDSFGCRRYGQSDFAAMRASRFTSSMTGMAPVPVSITSRRHFQGMSSSIEGGVCPNAARFLFCACRCGPGRRDRTMLQKGFRLL